MGNERPETDSPNRPGTHWTHRGVCEFVTACYDRDTILDVLMGYATRWFPARMTLIVGRSWVQVFAVEGFDLYDEIEKHLRRADIDPRAPAVSEQEATGTAEELGLGLLFGQLGIEAGRLETVGIEIGGRVAIVIVGAVSGAAVDTAELADVAAVAGDQLERVIRMAKAGTLPPEDRRIPPFPDAAAQEQDDETRRAPSLGDTTRRLERLTSLPTGKQPHDSTSFGLPFATKVLAPGEDLLARISSAAHEDDGSEPGAETFVGAPSAEDRFPGNLEEPDSGPEPSDDPRRTDLGGLRAQPTISGHAGERPPRPPAKIGSGTIMASPAPQPTATPPPLDADARKRPRNPAKSTDLGGIQGETRLVSRALERALEEKKTQPSSLSKSDKVTPPLPMPEPQAEPDVPVSSGAWMNPTSKGGAPGAMILKPARKRMRADSQQQAASRPRQKTPKRPTLPDTMPPETKRQRAGQTSHIENNATKLGWSRDDLTRRAPDPIAEPAKDDWFDYFADDAVGAPDPSARIDALDFAVSEGSEAEEATSLPPETLERLLDSGPQMVDMQEAFLVLDSRDAEKAFEAAEQVAEVGAAALGVLDLMFPGRIFIDRYQHPDELPPVNEHGPLLHALVRIGDKSVDIARRHINDSSNETRFYATFLFTRLNAEGVLSDLFARLFDRDTQVRRLAADILLDYHQTPDFDRCVRKPLRAELLSTEDIHVEVAARLIGRLRDSDAVIALIDTMEETEAPRVRQAVREALKVVTLHSWSSPYEWRHWWEKARDESRSTWLVEALDSPAYELRQLAFDEVRRIPGLDLNYHPEQPPKLRRRAQQELTSWFQTHDY